jgi:hypothetical protein
MEPQTNPEQCAHIWVIDAPDGVTSYGRCKRCHMEKEFINDWNLVLDITGKSPNSAKPSVKEELAIYAGILD